MRKQQTTKENLKSVKKDEKIMKAFKNLQSLIGGEGTPAQKTIRKKTASSKDTQPESGKRKRDPPAESTEGVNDQPRKKRRLKPGTKALREIKNQQKTAQDKNAIAKKSFDNVVREILNEVAPANSRYRIGSNALKILQEISEGFLVQCFSLGHSLDIEIGRRSSITKKGLKVANTLLTKPHLLNNTVRGTDILGEFTEGFPKIQTSKKKVRVFKKKKQSGEKRQTTEQEEEAPETSVEVTAMDQEEDEPADSALNPTEVATSKK
jgi:histone H3/H4